VSRNRTPRGKDRPRVIRALLARDGSSCCHCGQPVEFDVEPNHPRRASLDHIVPRSEGGDNSIANLRLAHRGCDNPLGGRRTRPGYGNDGDSVLLW
jgi:5-methylcytosine-specific restriction endonuclease McrA